jgi:hypothetical protein
MLPLLLRFCYLYFGTVPTECFVSILPSDVGTLISYNKNRYSSVCSEVYLAVGFAAAVLITFKYVAVRR